MNSARPSLRTSSLVSRLILIAALFSMAFTWLPQPPQAPIPGDYPFSALILPVVGSPTPVLQVSGSTFPANHTYLIKVKRYRNSPWINVGQVQTDSFGSFYAVLPLPDRLRGVQWMRACMKDPYSKKKVCTMAYRP